MEELQEKEDRERRSNNVIMFNVPESNKDDSKERVHEDTEICSEVLKESLKVEEVEIEKVYRLGRRQEGKIRPLTVKLTRGRDNERNEKIMKTLEEEMETLQDKQRVILLGDSNGHLGFLVPQKINKNGINVEIKREGDGFLRLLYKQEEKCKNFPAQLMEHMDMVDGEIVWQRGGPMKWENWNSDEVSKILRKIKANKQPGPDGIKAGNY
ncbi:hypothetical protein SK128_013118 [Halocaridina rubra]|uniref:Endonuclease/exonuclease/phosphatase domain-containing protein n=1 Tax=Halocaridina rubra TaxID=373956 RepID=A0AAN9A024_HALRR